MTSRSIRGGDPCPTCGDEVTDRDLPAGLIYCRNGHLITLAPFWEIDLEHLPRIAAELGRSMRVREKPTLRKLLEDLKIDPDQMLDAPLGERTGDHPVVQASGTRDLDEGTSVQITVWKVK